MYFSMIVRLAIGKRKSPIRKLLTKNRHEHRRRPNERIVRLRIVFDSTISSDDIDDDGTNICSSCVDFDERISRTLEFDVFFLLVT